MKRKGLIPVLILIIGALAPLFAFKPALADPGPAWLTLSIDEPAGEHGGTIDISTASNASTVQVKIWDPSDTLIYDQSWPGNDSRALPISPAALPGRYTIHASTEGTTVESWFTVLDLEDFTPASFPLTKTWNNVDYTVYGNWTLQAIGPLGSEMWLDFSTLRLVAELYDLDVYPRYNSRGLVVRLQKGGVAIDFRLHCIHSGVKLIINGTLDQAREFSFNVDPSTIKQGLGQSFSSGALIFDYSDIQKAGQAFTWDRDLGVLNVSLPQTFRLDPTIFTSGFESGSIYGDDWDRIYTTSGEYANISIDNPRRGVYHATFITTGTGTDRARIEKDYAGADENWQRAYVTYNDTITGAEATTTLSYYAGGTILCDARIAESGGNTFWAINYRDDGGWTHKRSDVQMFADTEYLMEFYINISATDGNVALYIDEVLVVNATGIDTDNYGVPDEVQVGQDWSNMLIKVDIDQYALSTSGLIGPDLWYENGFEGADPFEGLTQLTTGGGYEITTDPVMDGVNATYIYLESGAGWSESEWLRHDTVTYHDIAYLQAWVQWNDTDSMARSAGARNSTFLRVGKDWFPYQFAMVEVVYHDVGVYNLTLEAEDDGAVRIDTDYNVVIDTWYCMEIGYFIDDTDGWARLWVNGSLIAELTGINSTSDIDRGLSFFDFGLYKNWPPDPGGTFWDNITVSESYIGFHPPSPPAGDSYLRDLTQALTMVFNLDRAWNTSRALTQALTWGSSLARSWDTSRALTQAISWSSSLTRSWNTSRALTQAITITFNAYGLEGVITYLRDLSLAITITFNAYGELTELIIRDVTLALTMAFNASGRLGVQFIRDTTLALTTAFNAFGQWAEGTGWVIFNVLTQVSGSSTPIEGVSVSAFAGGLLIFSDPTNSSGYISPQNVTAGNYTMFVQVDEFYPQTIIFILTHSTTRTVSLTPLEDSVMIDIPLLVLAAFSFAFSYLWWVEWPTSQDLFMGAAAGLLWMVLGMYWLITTTPTAICWVWWLLGTYILIQTFEESWSAWI